MAAKWIKLGEPPPTPGGDVELIVAKRLSEDLPEGCLVVSGLSLPTQRTGFFYDFDIVLVSPFFCDVIEVKHLTSAVMVEEDGLWVEGGFEIHDVFSRLDRKGAVLKGRFDDRGRHGITCPFDGTPRVESRVVLGPDCPEVHYNFAGHEGHRKVLTLPDAITYYADNFYRGARRVNPAALKRLPWEQLKGWDEFAQKRGAAPKRNRLGRFSSVRPLAPGPGVRNYQAEDEPPCPVKVHLREYLFDPALRGKALEIDLENLTRDMQLLRRLRHPCLACVTGHFRTGWSLVQVSDWFDGKPLDELWVESEQVSLPQIVQLMLMLTQALAYCHSRGVFHRNLDARAVLVAPNWNDLRLCGFDLAKQLDRTRTVGEEQLRRRDPRLVPPEERQRRGVDHHGRYDMYQLGVLFYRMMAGGAWPFDETGHGPVSSMRHFEGEPAIRAIRAVVMRLLAQDPEDRPGSLAEVERELASVQ